MGFMKNLGELLKTRSDFFIKQLLQHIVLSLIAIVIITVVGVTTGVLISKSKKAASVVIGLTNVLYTILSIAMFGYFVSIDGIRNMVVMTIALVGIGPFIGAGGLGVAIWRGITSK